MNSVAVTLTDDLVSKVLNSEIIKNTLYSKTSKADYQDREDLRQECIARILNALKTYEVDKNKIESFCVTIIRRTVVDYYRYKKRAVEKNSVLTTFNELDYGHGEDESKQGGNMLYYSSAMFKSLTVHDPNYHLSNVRTDFERNRHLFSPSEQKVLEFMLYNEENMTMTLAEIATKLNIDRSHPTRALKKLRNICAV